LTQQKIEKSFTVLKADTMIPDDWSIKKSVDIQIVSSKDIDMKQITQFMTQPYYLYESTSPNQSNFLFKDAFSHSKLLILFNFIIQINYTLNNKTKFLGFNHLILATEK
jgi:hypothetical protein